MKRRLVKKWVKRYITPLIKDLLKVNYRVLELENEQDPQQRYIVEAVNYICVNGTWKLEAEKGAPSQGMRKDIQHTANAVKDILSTMKNPRLRTFETDKSYGVYLRLVDFADWPEGYVHKPYKEEVRWGGW